MGVYTWESKRVVGQGNVKFLVHVELEALSGLCQVPVFSGINAESLSHAKDSINIHNGFCLLLHVLCPYPPKP